MLGEHASAERVDFAERNGSHSGSFEPETESTNSREEVEHIHFAPSVSAACRARSGVWDAASHDERAA